MVEITAINHKLLFEITALISPGVRKEKERGLCKAGGQRRDGLPPGSEASRGDPSMTTQLQACHQLVFPAGNSREMFHQIDKGLLGWSILSGGTGLSWVARMLLKHACGYGGVALQSPACTWCTRQRAGKCCRAAAKGPDPEVFTPNERFVGTARI